MNVLTVKEEPVSCPLCGGRVIPVLYGSPTAEAFEEAEKGNLKLGGCCIETDEKGRMVDPEWVCSKCQALFKLE